MRFVSLLLLALFAACGGPVAPQPELVCLSWGWANNGTVEYPVCSEWS
jgi:hypothetical protein